ncbi:hypothetical protein DFH08DRAFT_519497 [Mycena albidolilacea]|uniref:Uncharacterized protein n=1 Tax=Mycena albidolilacea TaxID=1033008 RepID=A0AAD6Z3V3_9AGAR|nr:hypothetical protein DFH08DRAFT_519497 [Mycena albidolilacea]
MGRGIKYFTAEQKAAAEAGSRRKYKDTEHGKGVRAADKAGGKHRRKGPKNPPLSLLRLPPLRRAFAEPWYWKPAHCTRKRFTALFPPSSQTWDSGPPNRLFFTLTQGRPIPQLLLCNTTSTHGASDSYSMESEYGKNASEMQSAAWNSRVRVVRRCWKRCGRRYWDSLMTSSG